MTPNNPRPIRVIAMHMAQAFPDQGKPRTGPTLADALNAAFEEGYMSRGCGSVGHVVWVELVKVEALQALYPAPVMAGIATDNGAEDPAAGVVDDTPEPEEVTTP